MKRFLLIILISLFGSSLLPAASEVEDRVVRGAVVLREITEAPDKGIPQDLLDSSACVAIIPGMKRAGFIFGANYGKGLMSCRTDNGTGPWSAPSMFLIQGGSFGLQIGVQSIDLILVVRNLTGMESLLSSKFTLGGDSSVAAGPIGRTMSAETDAWMSAKILTYSRSKGIFGGIMLKGAVLRPDRDANHVLYNKAMEPRDILLRKMDSVPKDVQIFLDQINKISPTRIPK